MIVPGWKKKKMHGTKVNREDALIDMHFPEFEADPKFVDQLVWNNNLKNRLKDFMGFILQLEKDRVTITKSIDGEQETK